MSSEEVPLSILDLAMVGRDDSVADALNASVLLAQAAEERGYRRILYAEHHNMASIASAATSVLIAHVAAKTERIVLGSGGVMLPNHSPLAIAEQFGTLASLHPGRIELGLGRAPGSDQATARALRGSDGSHFPNDVVELQAFLSGNSIVPGVEAIPGSGTNVPITILGSSLFGAQLAAQLGLPFAFASHFAPAHLDEAVAIYRSRFLPSDELAQPHVTAAMNVVVAPTEDEATDLFERVRHRRVGSFLSRGYNRDLTDAEIDELILSPQGRQITDMMRHTAVGTPATVRAQIAEFQELADADEVIVTHNGNDIETRIRSVHLVADAWSMATQPS